MGYGDFQTFLPSESLYKEPGMALVAAKAEGVKKASYLSSMDQFYAELGEKSRQFDLSYGLEESRFGLSEKRFGLEGEKFVWEKERFERVEELERWREAQVSGRHSQALQAQSELAEERLDFERDVFESGEAEREATGEFFQDIYGSRGATGSQTSYGDEEQVAWDDYYNTVMAW